MDSSEDQLDLLPAVAEELWRPLHQGVLCFPEHIHDRLPRHHATRLPNSSPEHSS